MTALSHPLPKATKTGFTVLPNRIIDCLLASGEKYTSDSLALAIYVVRHIPSQSGSLVLSGDFSQATVCDDLGWGSTNRARLKRALAHLSDSGILSTELRDNNTILLHVSAELNGGAHGGRQPQPAGEGWKDSLQGDTRFSPTGGQEKSSQASRAPASLNSKFKHKNKYIINNLHHPEVSTSNRVQARESLLKDDDDVRKLLGLYTLDLKKPLTRNAANAFAETYALNGRPYELVETALRTMARHPLLLKNTISPNAVWELGYMQKQAQTFDARVRGHLREVSRGGNADYAYELQRIAEAHGCDARLIAAYFQADVDGLLAEKARWESGGFAALADTESDHPVAPEPELETQPTTAPAGLETDDAAVVSSTPEKSEAPALDSSLEGITLAEGLSAPVDPACPPQADQTPPLIDTSPSEDSDNQLEPGPDQKGVPALLQLAPSAPPPLSQNIQPSRGDFSLPAELAAAASKAELARIVSRSLATELSPDRRRRLQVLADLAAIERMSFQDLRRLVHQHLAPPGAVAA